MRQLATRITPNLGNHNWKIDQAAVTPSKEAISSNSFIVWIVAFTPRWLIRSRESWPWGYGGVVLPGFLYGPFSFSGQIEGLAALKEDMVWAVGADSEGLLVICITDDAKTKSELKVSGAPATWLCFTSVSEVVPLLLLLLRAARIGALLLKILRIRAFALIAFCWTCVCCESLFGCQPHHRSWCGLGVDRISKHPNTVWSIA